MPMPIFPPTVPILGQQFRVLAVYSTAVIECSCHAKTVIVLTGTGRVRTCVACQKSYGIAKAGSIEIGEAVPSEETDVPNAVLQEHGVSP